MPSATTTALPFSPAELSYLHTSLSSQPPIRPDSRAPTDFRPLNAETGILPATNGSAHVSFSDGSEAIVGVKLEVEKTKSAIAESVEDGERMDMDSGPKDHKPRKGRSDWITFGLTVPGVRDDDSNQVFLEEMLREPLTTPSTTTNSARSLQDKLVINTRWHWHIYIDVLLISAHGLASYPLPLLSMATNLALRDTRVPKLKSEGEEDPIADDDWMASLHLYPRNGKEKPPVTLLVVAVGDNVLFDPSHEELKGADGVVAISIGVSDGTYRMLAMRMIDTSARDTMKGVPRTGDLAEGVEVPGVWRPRVGGLKRDVLKNIVKSVLTGGVAEEVMNGLDVFLQVEREADVKFGG